MISLRRFAVAILVLPGLLAACGGKVVIDGGGGQGAGGASGTCPVAQPQQGQPCTLPAQMSCTYGTCCPQELVCEGGHWQAFPTDCPVGPCPVDPPVNGSACDTCSSGTCSYPCPGSAEQIVAICTETGTWFHQSQCPTPPPASCGDMTCNPGEVCVQWAGPAGFTYECAPDPCAPAPLSCGCANDVCGGVFTCTNTMGANVYCDCPTCG